MMTPHERALLAIYDLKELDRIRNEMQERWEALVIAGMEVEFMDEGRRGDGTNAHQT